MIKPKAKFGGALLVPWVQWPGPAQRLQFLPREGIPKMGTPGAQGLWAEASCALLPPKLAAVLRVTKQGARELAWLAASAYGYKHILACEALKIKPYALQHTPAMLQLLLASICTS